MRAARAPRVCILIEFFSPVVVVGGVEIQAYQLADRLAAEGQDLVVLTRYIHPGAPASERIGRVPVIRIPPRGLLRALGWRAALPILGFMVRCLAWLVIHAGRYDIVLVHGAKVLIVPAGLARLVTRKPWIVRVESPLELAEEISQDSLVKMGLSRSGLPVRVWQAVRAALLRRADRVVAVSADIYDRLRSLGFPEERIAAIPNAVDVTRFAPAPPEAKAGLRARLGLPRDRILVAYTGRLSASKGVMSLAAVWRELRAARSDVHLVLLGSGGVGFDTCETELREFIQAHGLETSLSMPGAVDNVPEYLQAADLFVFPSWVEGFALALLEALASGLPTIATRVGGAAEVVEDGVNGYLVEPRDERALRLAFDRLLARRPEWPAMGRRSRDLVTARYSLDSVADRYRAVFADLAPGEAGSQPPEEGHR